MISRIPGNYKKLGGAGLANNSVTAAKLATSALGYALGMINGTFVVSASAGALTIALKTLAGTDPSAADPVYVIFRNATGATGDFVVRSVTAATSLVIPSGATLQVTSSTAFRLWIEGFDDAGTFRLGVSNQSTASATASQIFPLNEGIASSTAISGTSNSAGVIYTGAAVTTKAMRILAYLEWSASGLTAGTWTTTNLILTQLFGPGIKKPGDSIQTVLTSTTTGAATTSVTPATALSASLTPTSAVNLVEVTTAGKVSMGASLNNGFLSLKNGTTLLVKSLLFNGTASVINAVGCLTFVDKPNSASPVTYNATVQGDATNNAGYGSNGDATTSASMVLKELMG